MTPPQNHIDALGRLILDLERLPVTDSPYAPLERAALRRLSDDLRSLVMILRRGDDPEAAAAIEARIPGHLSHLALLAAAALNRDPDRAEECMQLQDSLYGIEQELLRLSRR